MGQVSSGVGLDELRSRVSRGWSPLDALAQEPTPLDVRAGQGISSLLQGAGEFVQENPLQVASMIPIGGYAAETLAGLVADAEFFNRNPEERTIGNYALSGTGAFLPFLPGVAGMVAGKKALGADLGALKKAEDMKSAGMPADDIYAETKWWLDHPDGKPRFEIDDSGATVTPLDEWGWAAQKDFKAGNPISDPLSSFMEHSELERNYGGLFDFGDDNRRMMMHVRRGGGESGSYGDNLINLTATESLEGGATINKSTGMHELEHVIQEREGFARGGSVDAMQLEFNNARARLHFLENDPDYQIADKKMAQLWDDALNEKISTDAAIKAEKALEQDYPAFAEARKVGRTLSEIKDEYGYDAYRRLAGESEARLVQDRMNMDMQSRLADPFFKNYDVPLEDQIIRHDGGVSEMKALTRNGEQIAPKQPWQMTSKEYDIKPELKPTEAMYFPIGSEKIEVVQNPTGSDMAAMKKEAIKKYGIPGNNDPALRFTEDASGNKYYWPSYAAIHPTMEPMISAKIGAEVNQNMVNTASHRAIVRRALYEGQGVPSSVTDEYPGLIDEVLSITGNKARK